MNNNYRNNKSQKKRTTKYGKNQRKLISETKEC